MFGRKLRQIRYAKNVGISEMAAKLQLKGWDITDHNLAHAEAGRRIIADGELELYLRVLGCRMADLDKDWSGYQKPRGTR